MALLTGCSLKPGASGASADVTALLTSALQDQVAGRSDQATATYQKVLKQDPSNKIAF